MDSIRTAHGPSSNYAVGGLDVFNAGVPVRGSALAESFLVSAYPYGWSGHVAGLRAVKQYHRAAEVLVRHLALADPGVLALVCQAPALGVLPRHWAEVPRGLNSQAIDTAVCLALDGMKPADALAAAHALCSNTSTV